MIGPIDASNPTALKNLAYTMREHAQANIQVNPLRSTAKTWEDVVRNTVLHLDQIRADPSHAILRFPRLVSLTLSLDATETTPLHWHMSIARVVPGLPPQRVPNHLARRLATTFETPTEGAPEGALVHVRHFRGPYKDLN